MMNQQTKMPWLTNLVRLDSSTFIDRQLLNDRLASIVLLCVAFGKVPILIKSLGLQKRLGCSLSSTDFQIKSVKGLVLDCSLPDEMAAIGLAL